MLIHKLATLTGVAVVGLLLASPASALSMAECSTKYNAAKEAGTLDGKTWNQFRRAECGSDASAAKDDSKSRNKTTKADDSEKSARKTKKAKAEDDAGNGLSMKECSAKYQAAKAADTLNGMKWNDFRKAECSADAADTAAKPARATKAKKASTDDDAGSGLSMKECSAKYQAAKAADTLNGMKWNDFRKAECSADAAADDTVPAASEARYDGEPAKPTARAPRGVKFPTAVSQKYKTESPGKARMHTCLELYYANKDANTLNGLKWIQKGGGFYSLCNAKLKS
jgi:hypothetical protein